MSSEKFHRFAISMAAALLASVLLATTAYGEVELAKGVGFDGYFRPRFELDGRDFDTSTGHDQYITLRTRLGIRAKDLIPDTTFYFLIADSRTLGYSDPYLTGEPIPPNNLDANLGVNQVWLKIDNLGFEGFYFMVGRMENNQGRNRIFGPGNWSHNGPRTYDGVKAGFANDAFQINLWSLYGLYGDRHWYPDPDQYPDHKTPDPDTDWKYDHTLNGLDIRSADQNLQLLAFLDYDQARVEDVTRDEKNPGSVRYTVALYSLLASSDAWKRDGGISFAHDIACQFGTVGTTTGEADVYAWLWAGDFAFSFGTTPEFWAGIGWDVTSGDQGTNHTQVHYFYDYYYSKHVYRGTMDYFKDPFKEPSLGLQDYIVRMGMKPVDTLSLKADVHYFRTEQPFDAADDGKDANVLGMELDVVGKLEIRQGIEGELGMDFFWPTADWKGDDANYSSFVYSAMTARF